MRTFSRLQKTQRGQVMVIGALMSMVFVFFWMAVFGVGEAVAERTHLQDAADGVAYTQAVWCARWLNWLAYSNRAIVANFIILTTFAIIHSHAKFWYDIVGVFGLIADALKALFGIGAALDPFVKVAAIAVSFYEKFAYYLADIGIPVYHVLIGILHIMQNAWWVFLVLFPLKGNQSLAYTDPEVFATTGSFGVDSLISSFTSTDAADTSGILTSIGQLAFTAYTYYQYFMMMFHKEDPAEGNISAKVGASKLDKKSVFNRKISVWKRWKWITEETAHKHQQTKPWSWDDRGLFNFNFTLNLGIIKFNISSGGSTHVERWSLYDESPSFSVLGIGKVFESPKGPPLCVVVGLWQWHKTFCPEPGEPAYDSMARDFFELTVRVWFPFVGWKTVFSLGVHEVELSSEDYGLRGESEDSKDPSETARERGETTEESAEGMEEKAEDLYEEAEELSEDSAERSDESGERSSEAGEARGAEPPNESLAESLMSQSSSLSSQASSLASQSSTKSSQAAAKRTESQETSAQAQQLQTNAANLNNAIGGIKDTIDSLTSSLYHDGPVLFFWAYMSTRWGAGDGPNPRDTEKRFVFPLDGYKHKLTPPYMWEVNTDPSKISGYQWATEPSPGFIGNDGRSVAHYVMLFRPYRNLLQIGEFGLEKVMFGDPDDTSGDYPTAMMGDQYTVFSRGEVFYLNPFARDEIPNVFNPWWRPRLSPISKDIDALLAKTGLDLGGTIGSAISGVVTSIIPH